MYVALRWPQQKEEKIDTGYQQPLLTKCCSPKAAACSQYTSVSEPYRYSEKIKTIHDFHSANINIHIYS